MNLPDGCQVHMVGVCGVGMAGVARLLAARGHAVSGCDARLNELTAGLRSAGVKLYQGHSPGHIEDLDADSVLVVTSAVSADEPELVAARAKGIPVVRRGDALAALISQFFSIAVCGTHGKTTTACFAARLFQELGVDPGWCVGGFTATLGGVAEPGGGELLVVEADESDGTLRHYHPAVTVVNNIGIDHLEHFAGEDDLLACFRDVARQSRDAVCVCADDERAARVARECGVDALDYGLNMDAALRAVDVETIAESSSFDLVYRGARLGRITIGVGGVHNVVNALGACAAALACGYDPEDIAAALPEACRELPGRRFDVLGERDGARYVADYAHHPVELKAAVQMALECRPSRVVAVFQPHRYTRTRAMGADFPTAFEGVDEVILLPVYAASEEPLEGGDICDLYARFRESEVGFEVTLCRSLEECCRYLRQTARGGDLVLIAGAGDVIKLRGLIFNDRDDADFEGLVGELNRYPRINASLNSALRPFSVFPTRGRAAVMVEAADKNAIKMALDLCRKYGVEWLPVGEGFNTFFSDSALMACVVRMTERTISRKSAGDSAVITVACGLNGAVLLEHLSDSGLGGLEFMAGVPGSVGGWLAMNAGAHGGRVADRVESVEIVNSEGEIAEVAAAECGFSYRSCAVLKRSLAVSCRLRLRKRDPVLLRRRARAFRDKRIPLAGLRTAGSVFKNPAGASAGRLLEKAGCKGLRIGGAYVTDFHANIIVAGDGCVASDLLALMWLMRNRVRFRFGVQLEYEIRGVE